MAKYMLTGINAEKWKQFKAACNIRGCTMKESFIDHINIIVAGYQTELADNKHKQTKPKKGGKSK